MQSWKKLRKCVEGGEEGGGLGGENIGKRESRRQEIKKKHEVLEQKDIFDGNHRRKWKDYISSGRLILKKKGRYEEG